MNDWLMPMMPTHASDAPASRTYQSGISGTARRVPSVNTKWRTTNARNGGWLLTSETNARQPCPPRRAGLADDGRVVGQADPARVIGGHEAGQRERHEDDLVAQRERDHLEQLADDQRR